MTNYYSVIEHLPTLMPKVVISFTDNDKANEHAKLLNVNHDNKYIVIPSTINLYMPEVKA